MTVSETPSRIRSTEYASSSAARAVLAVVLIGIVLYLLIGLWVLPPGVPIDSKRAAMPLFLCLYPIAGAVILERLRSREPYPVVVRRVLTPRRVALLIGFVGGVRVFFDAFMAWKAYLPFWGKFRADPWLADLDAWLSGGRDAWLWIAPIVASPAALVACDLVYYLWFPLMAYMVVWRAWRGDARFILAFVVSWIVLGTGLALAAHSAGPVFYQQVTGSDRYGELVRQVEAAGWLRSRLAMDNLWRLYANGWPSSISAFPSMHVAASALFAAVCWREHRWWAYGLAVCTALIAVATVALGWHYAVDAYVAILGALLLWHFAGWLLGDA